MTGWMVGAIAAALLVMTAAVWAQANPAASGAAGAAQSQGVTATPETSGTPAPGAPTVGSGSAAGTGQGVTPGGGLGGVGQPGPQGTGAAMQTTVPAPPASSAKP